MGQVPRHHPRFDVYSSVWFSAIYLLLMISLVGCVVPRTKQHWKAMRSAPPKAPKRLTRMPGYASFISAQADADSREDADETFLERRRSSTEEVRIPHQSAGRPCRRRTRLPAGDRQPRLPHRPAHGHPDDGDRLSVRLRRAAHPRRGGDVHELARVLRFVRTGLLTTMRNNLPDFRLRLDTFTSTFDDRAAGNQFGQPRSFDAKVPTTTVDGQQETRMCSKVNEPVRVNGGRCVPHRQRLRPRGDRP